MTKNAVFLFAVTLCIGVVLLAGSFITKDGYNVLLKVARPGSIEVMTLRGFGIILTLIGSLPLIGSIIKAYKKKKFRDTHVLILATLDEIEVVTKYGNSGECPVCFRCSYVDENGKSYKFRSDDMWNAPNYRVGEKIKIYAEPDNYKHYIMDLYDEF